MADGLEELEDSILFPFLPFHFSKDEIVHNLPFWGGGEKAGQILLLIDPIFPRLLIIFSSYQTRI
jgi:hypothetical protein